MLWKPGHGTCMWPGSDEQEPTCNGFGYATSIRGYGKGSGKIGGFNRFDYTVSRKPNCILSDIEEFYRTRRHALRGVRMAAM